MLLRHTSWVLAAGGQLADEEAGCVEVGPLTSYCGEGLEGLVAGRVYEDAYSTELQGFATDPAQRSNVGLWALPAVALYIGLGAAKILKGAK